MWKWRNLSILGKIQIIKTFAIPKLLFRASVIPMPNDLVKEVNSIFYTFIWNGKDKLKKFLEGYPSTWKSFLNSCIFSVGGSLIQFCTEISTPSN